ncbi:hypothetical protein, partial [Methylobacterium brachiatum]
MQADGARDRGSDRQPERHVPQRRDAKAGDRAAELGALAGVEARDGAAGGAAAAATPDSVASTAVATLACRTAIAALTRAGLVAPVAVAALAWAGFVTPATLLGRAAITAAPLGGTGIATGTAPIAGARSGTAGAFGTAASRTAGLRAAPTAIRAAAHPAALG